MVTGYISYKYFEDLLLSKTNFNTAALVNCYINGAGSVVFEFETEGVMGARDDEVKLIGD